MRAPHCSTRRTPPSQSQQPSDVLIVVQSKASEPMKIAAAQPEVPPKPVEKDGNTDEAPRPQPKVPQVKHVSSVGLLIGSVLKCMKQGNRLEQNSPLLHKT
jgi:calcium-dependent protein kinase